MLDEYHCVADLGYVGVDGIDVVPFKRRQGEKDLHATQVAFNSDLSKQRAAVERAVAHLKVWRMLSDEGGRYRCPIAKYPSMLAAIVGLYFFAAYE
ncbi:hypothetical protein D8M20_12350 [Corynebacterium propinquum]|nr:hypothetical protein D8M20_12350 [Corynebacterium propinquum]